VVVDGLWYSVPVLLILSAHEFGHYLACPCASMRRTVLLPSPLPIEDLWCGDQDSRAFPSKALFDVGVAGPIAGFVASCRFS
jgi:hypothetical protein